MTTLDFISCAKCGEPLEDHLPNCPMCGQLVSPETVTELELPKPEEVVIEVQTEDHLRFRLPIFQKTWWRQAVGCFAILYASPGLILLVFIHIPNMRHSRDLIIAVYLALYGMLGLLEGVLFLRGGMMTFDLGPKWLIIRYAVGPFALKRYLRTIQIQRVYYKVEKSIAFLKSKRMKRKANTTTLVADHPHETARFVTQLIRRQLKTMGHELADH